MQSAEFVVLRDLMLQTKGSVDAAVARMDDEITSMRRDVVDIREKHAELDKVVAGVCASFEATEMQVKDLAIQHAEVYPAIRRIATNGFIDRLQSVIGTIDGARGFSVRAIIALTGLATSIVTGLTLFGLNLLAAHYGWLHAAK